MNDDSLIELGWIPPEDATDILDMLENLNGLAYNDLDWYKTTLEVSAINKMLKKYNRYGAGNE